MTNKPHHTPDKHLEDLLEDEVLQVPEDLLEDMESLLEDEALQVPGGEMQRDTDAEDLLEDKVLRVPEDTAKSFRLSAKKFFLTFSRVLDQSLDKQSILDRILQHEHTKHPESVVIARELHQDGTPHFHILLCFPTKKNVRTPNFFDFICGQHGHYTTVRSLSSTYQYILKNGDYLEWGKQVAAPNIHTIRRTIRAKLKQDHMKPELLFREKNEDIEAAMYQDNYRINHFYKQYRGFRLYEHLATKPFILRWELPPQELVPPAFQPYFEAIRPVLDFLNHQANNRHFKSRNLLITTHLPNFGKSSLFNLIQDISPCYIWPRDH